MTSSRAPSRRCGTAGPSPTASTGSSSPRSSPGARWSSLRAIAKVPPADPRHLLAGLPRGRPRLAPGDRARPRGAVGGPFRPRPVCRWAGGRRSMRWRSRRLPTDDERAAAEQVVAQRVRRRAGRGVLARPRPHHPRLPRRHPRRAPHELLPAGRRRGGAQVLRLAQAQPQGGARPAGASAAVRDLGLQSAGRGRAPALRARGAWRPALVGPPGGLPHRGPGPRQGADGQERGHRPDRLQGRVLRQAAPGPCGGPRGVARRGQDGIPDVHLRAARRHGQPCVGLDRGARAGRPPRRRRPVSRRRRGQGHRDVLGHRQRCREVLRLLARRRLRLRRFRRLRPQGDGHHRARGVGVGQAALPGDGGRHPEHRLHRRRHRRHERGRLRQRDAPVRAHPPRRSVRPPPRVRRPQTRMAAESFAERKSALRAPSLVLGRLRQDAHLAGRRGLPAQPEVDRGHPRDGACPRHPQGHDGR